MWKRRLGAQPCRCCQNIYSGGRSVLAPIRAHLKWSLLRYHSTLLTCASHASGLLLSRCLSNSVFLTQLVFFAAINGPIMAVALHNAAPLKPEIQFVQALSEYEAILTDDQKTTFRTYHRQQPPDATDVMRLTAEIDRENSHRKGRRCVGPRLTNILQAVQQFSTIVDTIVGGSQSQIACAIWGVLKMSIQVISLAFQLSSLADKVHCRPHPVSHPTLITYRPYS
jgi:hypothetical protein